MMSKHFAHIGLVGLMMAILLGCAQEMASYDAPVPEVKVDHVALSFTVNTENFGLHSSSLRSQTEDGPIEHGEVEGTANENNLNNLWVFLFENSNDKLKYMFHFRRDSHDPEYKLIGPFEQLGNKYRTPVKLIKPGKYTLVISANTYQLRFQNDHFSMGMGDPFLEDIKPYVGMSMTAFVRETSGNIHFANSNPAHDRDSQKNGLNASFINYNFIVPSNYTSKREPFVVPINLRRSLSKLVVTINNINRYGYEYHIARDYKLVEVVLTTSKLYKLFLRPQYDLPIGAAMNTKWYTHAILPLSPRDRYDIRPDNGLMRDKFPLLKKLSQEGFTTLLPETELFNYYIPPWAIGSDAQTGSKNTTKLKMVFEHKVNGTRRTYEIPIYDIIKGEKSYTIQHNTVYRLRLSFRGLSIRSVTD